MMPPLLEAIGLGYGYRRGAWALHGVDLRIDAGDRVAVLGANGAGKSTLLLALGGVVTLTEGELRWEGRPAAGRKSRSLLRDKVGILLQDPEDQIFAPTVEQDVAFGLVQRGVPEDAVSVHVHWALDRLGVTHLAKRYVHQLSLGEKKRLALAGLIVLRPALLLLDEPSAGLDHHGAAALLDVLRELQTDGTAVVLSTHDTSLAAQWATRVVVLDSGRVITQGDSKAILTDSRLLERARLAPPATYIAAAALLELFPQSAEWPLPSTPAELDRFARRIVERHRSHSGQTR